LSTASNASVATPQTAAVEERSRGNLVDAAVSESTIKDEAKSRHIEPPPPIGS